MKECLEPVDSPPSAEVQRSFELRARKTSTGSQIKSPSSPGQTHQRRTGPPPFFLPSKDAPNVNNFVRPNSSPHRIKQLSEPLPRCRCASVAILSDVCMTEIGSGLHNEIISNHSGIASTERPCLARFVVCQCDVLWLVIIPVVGKAF